MRTERERRVSLKMIQERFFFSENVRDLNIFTRVGRKIIRMRLLEDKEKRREKLLVNMEDLKR